MLNLNMVGLLFDHADLTYFIVVNYYRNWVKTSWRYSRTRIPMGEDWFKIRYICHLSKLNIPFNSLTFHYSFNLQTF